MAKKKKSKKKKNKGPSLRDRIVERLHEPRIWIYSGFFLAGLALLIGIHVGLTELQQFVYSHEQFLGPPDIQLADAPPELEQELDTWVDDSLYQAYGEMPNWADTTLCNELETILSRNPWVRNVDRVRKYPDGRVTIECEYRLPFVQVRTENRFYLVSRDCVRLPGFYTYDPTMLMVEGVRNAPPEDAGEKWKSEALRAALDVVECLVGEPYLSQITGIQVENYHGRVNAEAPHIALTTDVASRRILWGSAPGEELEENSVDEKLGILRDNFYRHGRADANLPVIDISIRPDKFFARS